MNLDFFKNKKVLITGHTGFKGAWLAFWLQSLGAKVSGYSRKDDSHRLFELLKLEKSIRHQTGDINDLESLRAFMRKEQPELVFHMAAQALVRRSYKDPIDTFQTNIMGSVNVLECIRQLDSVRSIVYVTTDKCYLNKNTTKGYVETDELGGRDPYSASKAGSELVMKSYVHSFLAEKRDLAVVSARGGNVLGGGDWSEDRLIPDFIRATEKNEPLLIRNPAFTRPWQHVLDCLYGYMTLSQFAYDQPKLNGESFNFGPNESEMMKVEKVIQLFIEKFGQGSYKIQESPSLHEEKTLLLDVTKANKVLGWKPIYNYATTIQTTAQWYKDYFDSKNMVDATLGQIQSFTDKCATTVAPSTKQKA